MVACYIAVRVAGSNLGGTRFFLFFYSSIFRHMFWKLELGLDLELHFLEIFMENN